MKKRTLGLIIAGVAAASMIGTGFAAWVITGNAKAEQTGQFAVDTVTDKGVELTATWGATEGTIKFLAPENATTGKWLTNDDATSLADLNTDLSLNFTFTGSSAEDFNITVTLTESTGVTTARTDKQITDAVLTIGSTTLTSGTPVALSSVLTGTSATLTIAYDWGTAFDSKNPYTFYNTFDYGDYVVVDSTTKTPSKEGASSTNDTIQTVAKNELTALNTNLGEATFKIVIEVTPKTAA